MKRADKIPRMTAGPIGDLGVVVNKLVKVGFAQISGVTTFRADQKSKLTLTIDTLFGEEIAYVPIKTEAYSFLSAMQVYLSEKKRYLSRVSFPEESSGISSGEITGDLYQEK